MIKLNPNYKLLDNHYKEVSKVIIKQIDRVLLKGKITKDSTIVTLSPRLRKYLELLTNTRLLEKLIKLKPEHIENVVINITNKWEELTIKSKSDYKIVEMIFVDYGYKQLLKESFINNIGLETCPYCNRNYTYSVSRNRVVKPEIDHFYPKATYPLLAVSFFNLIPSCQSCNGFNGKNKSNPFLVGLKSPYMIEKKDFTFTYKINNISFINPICGKSSIDVFFKEKLQVNSDLFNLEDLYSLHNDHVLELIIKRKIKYSKKYREYLHNYDGLKFSNKEIDRLILGNYSEEKDIHKRPLAKLYQDIGKELGLI